MNPPDRITLRGLRAHGRHGVYPIERERGQTFVIDVTLELDTRPAGRRDDLGATVDYGAVAEAVVRLVEGEPVRLLETLAARIARRCLAEPPVLAVEVTVHKPEAPLAVPFDDVTLTVRRTTNPDQMRSRP